MSKLIRNRYFFLSDVALLPLAVYLSCVLRLERWNVEPFWQGCFAFTITAVILITFTFRRTGIYSRYWQYASIEELLLLTGTLTLAIIATSLVLFTLLWLLSVEWAFPRSVPFIFLMLGLGVTAGPRFTLRALTVFHRPHLSAGNLRNVLIMGAGEAGSLIAREVQRNPQLRLNLVGFVDDAPAKQGMHIHGVPVLGRQTDIPDLVAGYHVVQIIIAMPAAAGKTIRRIVEICDAAGVQTKIMPGIYELIDGAVHVNQLRDVQIEDLLRREPVRSDVADVRQLLAGRRVLITGGGGSIGGELCRQVAQCGPAEIILLGHGENSIFEIYHDLQRLGNLNGTQITAVIADIRSASRLQILFEQYQPEIVFHAAAHKHVPLMELNPAEAITNNILGTKNLLAAAQCVGVERFVMISTDKAVNPTSVMGASKRVAELLVHQAAVKSGRAYVAVRFGNVLGSRGSVTRTFQKQIADGGPITVTDPDMKRYFMTIPEAVHLVLQAGVLGTGGEVFVLDMGEPLKIADLARDLVELSGLKVGRDIDIVFTGARPGEKLFEELFTPGEAYHCTRHQQIFIAGNASSFVPDDLDARIHLLAAAARRNDTADILCHLQALIPEYKPFQPATAPVKPATSLPPKETTSSKSWLQGAGAPLP